MNTIYNKSKSEIRAEIEKSLKAFIQAGGMIEICKPSRRKSTSKMAVKASRGFMAGTGGLATGYPRRTIGGF